MEREKKHRFFSRLLTILVFLLATAACGKVYGSFTSHGVILALCILLAIVSIAILIGASYLIDRFFVDRPEVESEFTFSDKDDSVKKN